jgi:hypothetical protein
MNSSRSPWGMNGFDGPSPPVAEALPAAPLIPPTGGGDKLPDRLAPFPLQPRFPEPDPPCHQQVAEKEKREGWPSTLPQARDGRFRRQPGRAGF